MSNNPDLRKRIDEVKKNRLREIEILYYEGYGYSSEIIDDEASKLNIDSSILILKNSKTPNPYKLKDVDIDALRNLYIEMEMKRFEYVNQNVCYGTYIASRGISVSETKESLYSLNGGDLPDDVAGRCEGLRNTFEMIPDYLKETGGEKGGAHAHCARTAGLNVYATSAIMGLGNPTKGVYTPSALTSISGAEGFPPLCGDSNYAHMMKHNEGRTLNTLIEKKMVKAGDVISIATGSEGSGHHALTVAAVHYDKKGENVVGYTLMDNNGGTDRTRLVTVDINDTGNYFNQQVHYSSVNDWARVQITAKADQMSEDELRMAIEMSRNALVSEVEILAKTEIELLTGNCFDATRRGYFVSQQRNLIGAYLQQSNNTIFYPSNVLYAQRESSNRTLENNKYLINNNIYGNVGDGNRIDQALARREGNAIGTEPELTGTGNLTADYLRRINANNNSRA